jgi:hypothetical protein
MLSQRHGTRPQPHVGDSSCAGPPRACTTVTAQVDVRVHAMHGVDGGEEWCGAALGSLVVLTGGNERQKNTLSEKDKCTRPSPLSAAAQHTARLRYGLTRVRRTRKPTLISGGLNTAFGGWEEGQGVWPMAHRHARTTHICPQETFTKRHKVDDWHVLGCSMADDG